MAEPMNQIKSYWIDVCAADEIPFQGSRVVRTPETVIAVFKTADGEIYALADECSFKTRKFSMRPEICPLSQGIVHGKYVTCPVHNETFSLETGESTGQDDERVQTYPIQVEDGNVQIKLTLAVEAA